MEVGSCVVSFATYEGGLLGLSAGSASHMISEDESDGMKQEFAFAASETSLNAIASEGNFMAVAGNEEVIKLFDLKNKVSCGEFSGEVHQSTITALAISKQCTHLLSGDEKGKIAIWRIKDQALLHSLEVRNSSKIVSMSMHDSGRMLLALYANSMVRLWNLLDARCLFKFKAGMSACADSEEEDGDDSGVEEEKADIETQKTLLSEQTRRVLKEFDQLRS